MDDTDFNELCTCDLWGSTWHKVEVLVVGAILATGKRTVRAVLHVVGLGHNLKYAQYHHVLNRAMWSGREASEVLLRLLLNTFGTTHEPLVFGIDETLERRWGAKISARALEQKPFCESQRPALDLPDVADRDPMERYFAWYSGLDLPSYTKMRPPNLLFKNIGSV